MPLINLKRFFSSVVVTIAPLILLTSGTVFAEENPNITPEPTPKKPTWEDATVVGVNRSAYTAGRSSVPRRSERFSIAGKTDVYQVESRTGWARNKPPHLTKASRVQIQVKDGQFLLKTPAGVVYPMVMVQQSPKS